MFNGKIFDVIEVGIFIFKVVGCDFLVIGDVGYIVVLIKMVVDICVGDIIIFVNNLVIEFLYGYK